MYLTRMRPLTKSAHPGLIARCGGLAALALLAACTPSTALPTTGTGTVATVTAPSAAVQPTHAPAPVAPAAMPVRLENPSGDNRCHYGPSIGPAQGVPVRSAPQADAPVIGHLPQDWTVFACSFSPDGEWMGVVHEHGLDDAANCPPHAPDCPLSYNCAVTAAQTQAGQVYAGSCHSGWILSAETYALTD